LAKKLVDVVAHSLINVHTAFRNYSILSAVQNRSSLSWVKTIFVHNELLNG